MGVDYPGPLTIHSPTKTEKAWIWLLTCFVTRAINLDIVLNMSTETFIRCSKWFAAWRGLSCKFDNSKTFKVAVRFLKSVFKDEMVREHLTKSGTLRRCPGGGHLWTHGAVDQVIDRARLTHDSLITVIVDIESIINSKPLSLSRLKIV